MGLGLLHYFLDLYGGDVFLGVESVTPLCVCGYLLPLEWLSTWESRAVFGGGEIGGVLMGSGQWCGGERMGNPYGRGMGN